MSSETARQAHKRGLGFAVLFRALSTNWTRARGITRVYVVDRHPRQLRLIADKAPQLRECPTMQRGALRPASPHPRANVRQIFQRYRPLRAFGLRHDLLTHVVIDPCGEPSFLSRKRTQAATAVQRSFLFGAVDATADGDSARA